MALNLERFDKIDQQSKNILHGFIRNIGTSTTIPMDIIKLCVLFYVTLDAFDPRYMPEGFELNEDDQLVTKTGNDDLPTSCYFKNLVRSGRCEWKFKIVKRAFRNGGCMIGLWRREALDPPLNTFFSNGHNQGYGYSIPNATKTRSSDGKTSGAYGKQCNDGDIVEMIADFENLTLSFKVNGEDQGKSHDLIKGEYRAAVYIWKQGGAIQYLG